MENQELFIEVTANLLAGYTLFLGVTILFVLFGYCTYRFLKYNFNERDKSLNKVHNQENIK